MTAEIEERFQSLDNAQAFHLADYSGVYFLCQGATVVYVGKAKNVARRLLAHFGDKDFDTVMVMRVPEELLASVEMPWIRLLKTKLNRRYYTIRRETLIRFTSRQPAALVKALNRAAAKERITKSEFVERAIRERIERLTVK